MKYADIRLEDGFEITEKQAALTEHDMHVHDALEVCIVLDNTIRFKQSRQDYQGQAGDIFLYRPFEPHFTLVDDAQSPAKWVMLLFSPSIVNHLPMGHRLLLPFYSADSSPMIHNSSEQAAVIKQTALRSLQEQKLRQPGWQTQRYLLFLQTLAGIYRHYSEDASYRRLEQAAISDIGRVIQYMLRHFHEGLDTRQLIQLSGLGKTGFYQQFKRITGLSPNQFEQRLRLQRAVHGLNHTDRSISEIAYDCGFTTASYFNRCFREHFHLSPRQHREQFVQKRRDR